MRLLGGIDANAAIDGMQFLSLVLLGLVFSGKRSLERKPALAAAAGGHKKPPARPLVIVVAAPAPEPQPFAQASRNSCTKRSQ